MPIILDGENAWEHYEGQGRPFLRALYGALAAHPELKTVTMSEAVQAPATPAQRHLSRVVDQRRLLRLDRPRRRPPRLGPAGRCAAGARGARALGHARGHRPGARGAVHRRGLRLVLVVRRRPLVGPRPGVRRPVPAAPAQRLQEPRQAGARGAVPHQHHDRAAADDRASAQRVRDADAGRRGHQLLRVGRRRAARARVGRRLDAPGRADAAVGGHRAPVRVRRDASVSPGRLHPPRPGRAGRQGRGRTDLPDAARPAGPGAGRGAPGRSPSSSAGCRRAPGPPVPDARAVGRGRPDPGVVAVAGGRSGWRPADG